MRLRVLTSCAAGAALVPLLVPTANAIPNASGLARQQTYTLEAVNADAPDDVWAVGWSGTTAVRKTLIEHWDGAEWTTVPSPNRSKSKYNALTGVAAISPTDAWAVGFYRSPSGYRALTEHWDGARWTLVHTPSGHNYSVLEDVSAVRADDIWAVGGITKHYGQWYRGLIEHWDGSQWSIVDSATPRRRVGGFGAVAAVNAHDVWAGAGNGNTQFGAGALFHFDGQWSEHDALNDGSVMDMSMDSAADGWAVGGPMTRHWDGHHWQQVANPVGDLETVSAYSPTDAWEYGDGFGHWDGATWSRSEQQVAGNFFGMDMLTSDDAWAVGGGSGDGEVAIAHWDGTTWTNCAMICEQ